MDSGDVSNPSQQGSLAGLTKNQKKKAKKKAKAKRKEGEVGRECCAEVT